MKTKALLFFLSLFLSARLFGAELTVHAAASLTDAMKEIATTYEKESGDKLQFNFGASSLLARQIEEGAPADLFLSADEAKMDALEKKGLLLAGTRRSLLSNLLVIVVANDASRCRSLHPISQNRNTRRLHSPNRSRCRLASTHASIFRSSGCGKK